MIRHCYRFFVGALCRALIAYYRLVGAHGPFLRAHPPLGTIANWTVDVSMAFLLAVT